MDNHTDTGNLAGYGCVPLHFDDVNLDEDRDLFYKIPAHGDFPAVEFSFVGMALHSNSIGHTLFHHVTPQITQAWVARYFAGNEALGMDAPGDLKHIDPGILVGQYHTNPASVIGAGLGTHSIGYSVVVQNIYWDVKFNS